MSTHDNDALVLNLATPIQRVRARVMDILIFGIVLIAVHFVVGLVFGSVFIFPGSTPRLGSYIVRNGFSNFLIISSIFGLVMSLIYAFFFIIVPTYILKGQTLGKKAVGIQVVTEEGVEISIVESLKREMLRVLLVFIVYIPFISAFSCLGMVLLTLGNLVLVFVDNRSKTVYDMIAGTIVVEA
jgi:uncharacterized RDD family membrane protein YckC